MHGFLNNHQLNTCGAMHVPCVQCQPQATPPQAARTRRQQHTEPDAPQAPESPKLPDEGGHLKPMVMKLPELEMATLENHHPLEALPPAIHELFKTFCQRICWPLLLIPFGVVLGGTNVYDGSSRDPGAPVFLLVTVFAKDAQAAKPRSLARDVDDCSAGEVETPCDADGEHWVHDLEFMNFKARSGLATLQTQANQTLMSMPLRFASTTHGSAILSPKKSVGSHMKSVPSSPTSASPVD